MVAGTDLLLAGEPLVLGGDLNVASAYPLSVSAYAFTIVQYIDQSLNRELLSIKRRHSPNHASMY
jgi:hypothetical protein